MRKCMYLLATLSFFLLGGLLLSQENTMAAVDSSGFWEYTAGETGTVLTAYKGTQTDVYAPGSITAADGTRLSVVKLGDGIFKNNAALNSVTLGTGITEIGANAFEGATSLVCIVTNDELTTIGSAAFSGCTAFNSIILYDTVTNIGTNAFSSCGNLTIYCNEDKPAYLYARANEISYSLLNAKTEPTIIEQDGFTFSILSGEAALTAYDFHTTDVVVPATVQGVPVTDVGIVFKGSNVTTVKLPDTIKQIYSRAFYKCTSLKEITIPQNATKIGSEAFSYSAITSVRIPREMQPTNALFTNCKNLKEAIVEEGVETLPLRTFMNCTALESVTLPSTLKTMSYDTFRNCTSLKSVYITDLSTWCNMNFIIYNGDLCYANPISMPGVTLYINGVETTDLVIPDSVTSISKYAFYDYANLKTVTIPINVTSIDSTSFPSQTILKVVKDSYAHKFALENSCLFVFLENPTEYVYHTDEQGVKYFLTNGIATVTGYEGTAASVVLPETVQGFAVTGINSAFKNSLVQTVELPNGLLSIGRDSFSDSALTEIVVPEGVVYIGDTAFSNCPLTKITIPKTVQKFGMTPFYNCTELSALYISDLAAWCNIDFIDKNIINATPIVGEGTNPLQYAEFLYVNGNPVTDIVLPEGITQIGTGTFLGYTQLKSIAFPNSLQKIEAYAFSNCHALEKVDFNTNVSYIGSFAFYKCEMLNNIVIPKNILEIDNSAFGSCKALSTVVLEEGVVTLGASVFTSCLSLESIIIPKSVNSIAAGAQGTSVYLTFPINSVLIVEKGSYAHAFAEKHCLLYMFTNLDTSYETYAGNGIHYMILNGEAVVTGVENTQLTEISIPSTIKGVPVTKIIGGFARCTKLTSATLPDSLRVIGLKAFQSCSSLQNVSIPANVERIGPEAFYGCTKIKSINLPAKLQSIRASAFYSSGIQKIAVPTTVTDLPKQTPFPSGVILITAENSYAHNYAKDNAYSYFVLQKVDNPDISYGAGVSGIVTYTNGTVAAGATVEILYDDGMVKESVTTDETGTYSFTYAEVGRYTIRATDAGGNTSSEVISIKRMNAFDVFLAGETDLVLKNGWIVSGSVSPSGAATVTLTDTDGNVFAALETEDGSFTFENVPNGSYILKAETETGSVTKEITVFNGDITGENLTIAAETVTLSGAVEVEGRDGGHHKRTWVQVTVYNEDGVAVAQGKTDKDGAYSFAGLPVGDYAIVAETAEMRPDKKHGFDRSHTLTGYAHISAPTAGTYTVETIVLYEENDHFARISGKVTAHGETQNCEVILTNVFRHEVARYTTGNNGKYVFENVRDGLYFITAVTESNGMGFAVVAVRHGKVYGNADITVYKAQKIHDHESAMREIPECTTREEAHAHRDKIAAEKRFYDGLSEKEKKQCSKEYIRRLNALSELLASCDYGVPEGVKAENGGTMVSGDELANDTTVQLVLSVEETTAPTIDENGIDSKEKFEHQSMKDAAGKKEIVKYYDISLTKNGKKISNVHKHTDTTGKLRITMEIPEEYRGHKHYSFVHMHNGTPQTLVDLDDDPNTVTFEVDKFSTFALAYTDEALTGSAESTTGIRQSGTSQIEVTSPVAGWLYIAEYSDDGRLTYAETHAIAAGSTAYYTFSEGQVAYLWDDEERPLCDKFTIEK